MHEYDNRLEKLRRRVSGLNGEIPFSDIARVRGEIDGLQESYLLFQALDESDREDRILEIHREIEALEKAASDRS